MILTIPPLLLLCDSFFAVKIANSVATGAEVTAAVFYLY
jgi:hypothetical protein